jgi:peptidoglycan/LPS O-acetylase OafA/YrhL
MRVKNLDALRAVAVLLVLGQHFEIQKQWSKIGWFGVELFFVLSGYLVAGLLFSEYKSYGKIRIGNFYARRGLKIYPAFYFMLFCTVLWQIFMIHDLPMKNLAAEVFFFQNYVYGLLWHTWSLAVEEHFYIMLPLVLLIMIRNIDLKQSDPFTFLPKLFLMVASITLIGRILVFGFAAPESYYLAYRATIVIRSNALLLQSLSDGEIQ